MKEVKQISFSPEKKASTNMSSPNFLENMSKLLVNSLKTPKYSELMKTISSTPQSLNNLSSLLNNERRQSVLPPMPLFGGQGGLKTQIATPTSNSHSVLPNNIPISLNIKTSQAFERSESQYEAGNFLKTSSAFGKILTPKATYSAPTGPKRKRTWLEVSSDEGNTSEEFVNGNSSKLKKKPKIDYISLFNKFQQQKDLSILDKFAESRKVYERSACNATPASIVGCKKEIKSYDAPLKVKSQELSSAESESVVEPFPSKISGA